MVCLLPDGSLARRVAASLASPICMGAILAQVLDAKRSFAPAFAVLGLRVAAPLALVVLVASASGDGAPLWFAQLLMTALVGACAVRPDNGLARWLELPAVAWVGTVSYGVYLIHVAIITLARHATHASLDPALTFAVAFPTSVALASASFFWFEQPAQRWRAGRRVTRTP